MSYDSLVQRANSFVENEVFSYFRTSEEFNLHPYSNKHGCQQHLYQLYIHFVFAVKYRTALLNDVWDERLRLDISAIVHNHEHKVIAINNMPDHIHLLVGLNPKQSIVDLMTIVKSDSSEWINKEKLTKGKFQWQNGYGAFSHSRSEIDNVVKYMLNQQEHHKEKSFLSEYRQLLKRFDISYDEQYIFKLPE